MTNSTQSDHCNLFSCCPLLIVLLPDTKIRIAKAPNASDRAHHLLQHWFTVGKMFLRVPRFLHNLERHVSIPLRTKVHHTHLGTIPFRNTSTSQSVRINICSFTSFDHIVWTNDRMPFTVFHVMTFAFFYLSFGLTSCFPRPPLSMPFVTSPLILKHYFNQSNNHILKNIILTPYSSHPFSCVT